MKTKSFSFIAISSALILLTGCASYRAASLDHLSSNSVQSSTLSSDIVVSAKAFDTLDCKRYLDRDVIREGYQPVQLFIHNNSNKSYEFSLDRISLPYAPPEFVARTVHTSTAGRICAYGIPGLIVPFAFPLIIPAVVDGIKSSEANEALDMDFYAKSVKNSQIVAPHSYFNKLIFVDRNEYQPSFSLTLIDQDSKKEETFNIVAG
jgi:hypothetical protein